jgi:LysR family transcriptional regulator, glycine cleavage system transcriptional activator
VHPATGHRCRASGGAVGGDALPAGPDLLGDATAERDGTGATWADYARLTERPDLLSRSESRFDRSDLMIQAAIGGLGLALGRMLLIEDDVREGLLLPVGASARASSSYWLVTSPELADSEAVVACGIGSATGSAARRTPAENVLRIRVGAKR